MRFARAYKYSTYAMVSFAFLALCFSDGLSLLATLPATAGIFLSWFAEAPRVNTEGHEKTWNVATLLFLGYSAISAFTGTDVIVAGAYFVLYLVVSKLFQRNTSKDYQHIHIFSFLMLVAGTVLNPSVSYGVFFFGFVITSTWALILFHLRKEVEDNILSRSDLSRRSEEQKQRIFNSKRIVGTQFFFSTSILSASVFVASSILFLAIPRVGMGFFFQKSRSSISMAGFSDNVTLGGHGQIKKDNTVVLRVKVSGIGKEAASSLHWRGVAFDQYQNGQWGRSRLAPKTRRQIELDSRVTTHHLLYKEPLKKRPSDNVKGRIKQEIYLEPTGYDVLFGASMPTTFEFTNTLREQTEVDRNDEIRYRHKAGLKYVVYSEPETRDVAALRKTKLDVPPDMRVYLQLPPDTPTTITELAENITKNVNNPYDKAKAIESWLQSELGYSLKMVSPEGKDPLEFFLFDRKLGHCEYFSSAMAVLARSVGIPSRNVNGFLGGEWNQYDDYLAVRAGDAHSWTELFFPGYGWVTFDATPPAGTTGFANDSVSLADQLRQFADTLRFKWFKWVVEYDLYRQLSLFKDIGRSLKSKNPIAKSSGAFKNVVKQYRGRLVVGVGLIALALILGYWMKRRDWSSGRNSNDKSRTRSDIANTYLATLTFLERHGHQRVQSSTPREFAHALVGEDYEWAETFSELTEIYYRAEYGASVDIDSALHATSLAETIENSIQDTQQRSN